MIGSLKVDEIAKINYVPEPGNLLDEYMSKFLAKYPSLITVQRLKHDWYLINNQTKVLVRLINGNKLVVRVGGGYQGLKELMDSILERIIRSVKEPKPLKQGRSLRLPKEPAAEDPEELTLPAGTIKDCNILEVNPMSGGCTDFSTHNPEFLFGKNIFYDVDPVVSIDCISHKHYCLEAMRVTFRSGKQEEYGNVNNFQRSETIKIDQEFTRLIRFAKTTGPSFGLTKSLEFWGSDNKEMAHFGHRDMGCEPTEFKIENKLVGVQGNVDS